MPHCRLHYFPESGNSYKLSLMLTLCGAPFERVWTGFASGVTRTPEWRRALNPMGEIPVLEIDGKPLTQTAPILLHPADHHARYQGNNDHENFEILRWLFCDNQKLSGFTAPNRFFRAFRPGMDPAVLAFRKARLEDFLNIFEHRMQQSPFIAAPHPTVADLSMCGYLMFPSHEAGYDFPTSHPAIAAWLARIAALPGWKAPYDKLPGQHMPCHTTPA
jgi:glutathione S-transferase